MNAYKVEIKSHKENVGKIFFITSELTKGFIKDIITPLTPYQTKIEDFVIKQDLLYLTFEGFLKELSELKLKTKVAKNVTEVTTGFLAMFHNRPDIMLNIWKGDKETRTYVNGCNFSTIDKLFGHKYFHYDQKSNTPYFQGILELVPSKDGNVWILEYEQSIEKVIYEEIVLND